MGELPVLLSASFCFVICWNLYSEVITLLFLMERVSEKVVRVPKESHNSVMWGTEGTILWGELC